jgi:hypothetical protein
MKNLTTSKRLISAWAGIVGPILFVAVFTLEGWLRPGYQPLAMYVSALSLGPRGWIQIVNFILFGILLFVFTRGVAAEFPSGKASRGGLILLTIVAFCYLFSGPFVMDPTGTSLSQSTVHGTIHGILGAIAFLLMPISCFVYLRRFNIDPNWQSLRIWTLVLGTVSTAAMVLLTISTKFPQLQNIFVDWLGLIQRALIIPFMIWVFIFALGLYRRRKQIKE